jgi:uncharacterized protein YidB (DUF937 family)
MTCRDEQSVGGALLQTSAQVGGAIGICLSSLVSTQREKATGSLLTGLRDASWMNAAWSWIGEYIVESADAGRNTDMAQYL